MTQIFLREKKGLWEASAEGHLIKGYGQTWKEAIGDFVMLAAPKLGFQFIPLVLKNLLNLPIQRYDDY